MIKLLLGGSPCTYWSIAQKNNRETEASGAGWELFKNYLIAKEKFKPDYFLYENNKSASASIKQQISTELNVDLMHINSALVSAQNRERFYAFNWGGVAQPQDRRILLRDVLESGVVDREKSYCLRRRAGNARDYFKKHHTQVAFEPIRIGTIESKSTTTHDSRQYRVYSPEGKAVTLAANDGGIGAKTGLYATPINRAIADGKIVYHVQNHTVTYNGVQYPLNLPDGYYIIRKLTPTESERLQTLPDGYTAAGISDTQRYKCLGNGWTADVITHILNGALSGVPKNEKLVVLAMYDGIATGRHCLDKMGFTNVDYYAYEIDKYAIQVAMKNYPDIKQCGDAFQVRNAKWQLS